MKLQALKPEILHSNIYRQLREHLDEDEYVARLFSDNFVILIKTDGEKSIEERLNQCIQDINSYNDKEDISII